MVERVLGNDEVLSSILSGGTINQGLNSSFPRGHRASKHIVSTVKRFRASQAGQKRLDLEMMSSSKANRGAGHTTPFPVARVASSLT